MRRVFTSMHIGAAVVATACMAAPEARPPLNLQAAGGARSAGQQVRPPALDHHQHLLSPAAEQVISGLGPPGSRLEPVDGKALVAMLDDARIDGAILLSNAYFFDGLIPFRGNAYAQVRAENDWTAEQAARFPKRLIAFCSFNPLAAYATIELRRCARKSQFRGLKLHLGTSGVDLLRGEHVQKLRRVLATANRLRFPVTVHLAASPAHSRRHSEIFINQVLTAAPDVPVIIAHLWGGAKYVDEALAAYAEAIASGHSATKKLYFDLAQIATVEAKSEENLRSMTDRIRQIGIGRMLYGSDGAWGNGLPPAKIWADFQNRMPLTHDELRRIAGNVVSPICGGKEWRRQSRHSTDCGNPHPRGGK
jgi:predicted TIM-barrel fold metal-dependent hydrolase